MNQFQQIRNQINMLENLFLRAEEIKIMAKEEGLTHEETLSVLDCLYTYAEFKHEKRIENIIRSIFSSLERECSETEFEFSEK